MIDDFAPSGPKKPDTASVDDIPEPEFKPPESFDKSYQVSEFSREEPKSEPEVPAKKDFAPPEPPKKRGKLRFKLPDLTRKQWLIVGVVAFILIGGGSALAYQVFRKPKPTPAPSPVAEKKEEKPKPKVYTSKLTGMSVTEAESKLPVTAVMIENSPDARPQSGLKDANVVYEAVAEGGITRFLTLFQEAQPDYIGPVRSVRPYYLDWLVPFDAPVAHVGGSPEALAQISNEGIKDLDYGFNSNYYHRISSRYAPHNVYTSRGELLALQNSKGWSTSTFTGWARKDEKAAATPTAKSIDFAISGFLYNPHYDYDPTTNAYKRSEAGKPHVDEKSGSQITPKVVIAVLINKSIHPDGVHTIYSTSGTGKAYIFQDGTVTIGTWQKADRKSEMQFLGSNGKPLELNKGNTWISAVELEGSITYTP